MLRQGISIPGITLIYLFSTLATVIFFSLFNKKNKELFTLFKKNMVGGPSIIFHRYHETGKTKIREHEMKSQQRSPKSVKKSCVTMPMHCTYGPLCRTCPPDHIQGENWKRDLKWKAQLKWHKMVRMGGSSERDTHPSQTI